MAKGRKICGGCGKDIGAVNMTCPLCNFIFEKKVKEVKEKKVKVITETIVDEDGNSQVIKKPIVTTMKFNWDIPKYIKPQELTSREHAQRILDLGKCRASSLLFLHKTNKNWSHVDWKFIEEKIGTI